MRKPPVRSYIHIAEPSALATRRGISPSLVRIGIMNGSRLTRCGRVAAQPLPLAQRLVDEPHVALLEVAQPAVDELRALRDVPLAKSSASTSAARGHGVAASRATPTPVMPPPTTSTSKRSVARRSSISRRSNGGIGGFHHGPM